MLLTVRFGTGKLFLVVTAGRLHTYFKAYSLPAFFENDLPQPPFRRPPWNGRHGMQKKTEC